MNTINYNIITADQYLANGSNYLQLSTSTFLINHLLKMQKIRNIAFRLN